MTTALAEKVQSIIEKWGERRKLELQKLIDFGYVLGEKHLSISTVKADGEKSNVHFKIHQIRSEYGKECKFCYLQHSDFEDTGEIIDISFRELERL